MMLSPLEFFLSDLIQDHEGGIRLVVDNARMTTTQVLSIRPSPSNNKSSLNSSSHHSCVRWESDEHSTHLLQSPRSLPHMKQTTATMTSEGNSDIVSSPQAALQKKTASPSCPIRKLSPAVQVEKYKWKPQGCWTSSNSRTIGSSNKFVSSNVPFPDQDEDSIPSLRPPLRSSPPPNAASMTASSDHGMILEETSSSEEGHDSLSSIPIPIPIPTMRLTRGLSKTLLGIEKVVETTPPVCPTRRPSAQPPQSSKQLQHPHPTAPQDIVVRPETRPRVPLGASSVITATRIPSGGGGSMMIKSGGVGGGAATATASEAMVRTSLPVFHSRVE
eukprot:Nitzschia sp. Nitz4//scaffold16_size188269//111202//112194//NITZ4_001798-RA/size188269-processed-gene-0.21-mRNA-1//1//CDS//3329538538//967//frame0